jgi:hypothetical protein
MLSWLSTAVSPTVGATVAIGPVAEIDRSLGM